MPELISTTQVCKMLGICRTTWYRYRAEHNIPSYRWGREQKYDVKDIEKFMKDRRKNVEG